MDVQGELAHARSEQSSPRLSSSPAYVGRSLLSVYHGKKGDQVVGPIFPPRWMLPLHVGLNQSLGIQPSAQPDSLPKLAMMLTL
jgi:hypothetical protein